MSEELRQGACRGCNQMGNDCTCLETIPPTGKTLGQIEAMLEAQLDVIVKANPAIFCGTCGHKKVEVRGRYPSDPHRMVCADCLASRMDQILDLAQENYGQVSATK